MSKEVAKSADAKIASMQRQADPGLSSFTESTSQTPVHQMLRLQGKAGNQTIQTLLGSGKPLPDPVRREMETRFGTDFRDVHIHDNPPAHLSAKLLRAEAFTHGSDIVFGAGRFMPGRQEGRYLLAHELAHVVQQSGRSPGSLSEARITQHDDAGERAADQAAQAVEAGTAVLAQPVSPSPTLAKAEETQLPWETAVETADEWWGKAKGAAYSFLIDSIRKIKRERIADLRKIARGMPASVQRIADPLIDAYEVVLDIFSSFFLGLVGIAVGLVSGIVHAIWGIATGLFNLAYMIGAFISGFVDERAREEFDDRAGAFLNGLKQLGPNLVRLWNAWKKEFDKASTEKQSLMIGELTGQIEALLLQILAGGKIAGSIPPLKVPARAFAFAGGITRGGGTALSINVAGPGMAGILTVNMASQIDQKAISAEKQKQTETAQTTKAAPKTKLSDVGGGKQGESPAVWSRERARAELKKIKRERPLKTKPEPPPSGHPTSPEEAFGKLREELGNEPGSHTPKPGGVKQAVKDAKPFPRGNKPGEISAEVLEHRHASEVREAFGVTGKDLQSAHGGASSWLNKRVWRNGKLIFVNYSRADAITTLLPPDVHRSFDDFWKAFARKKRKSGITKVPVSTMKNVMRRAVTQSKIPKGGQGPLMTTIEKEVRDLGLLDTDIIELPFAKTP